MMDGEDSDVDDEDEKNGSSNMAENYGVFRVRVQIQPFVMNELTGSLVMDGSIDLDLQ